jgi:sugar transferase (PEP-CTERM/EpsH1 system associated)
VRILFLTHRLPYAPNRGDRIRAYHLLDAMSRFAKVSLFSLVHDDDEAAQVARVPFADTIATSRVRRVRNLMLGGLRIGSRRPLTHSLLDAPGVGAAIASLARSTPPDLVVAYCSGMARFALAPPLAPLPMVLDMVDVDSAKWAELASRSRGARRWIYAREARTLRAFEAHAARRARCTLVVNEREETTMRTIAPEATIRVVPNGVDFDAFQPPGPAVPDPIVIFCGVMNYAPNTQGMEWFVREVWPLVRQTHPAARLLVVGASPTPSMQAWPGADPSIEVSGAVPDVRPYLWRAAVSIAPLPLARGLQNKALEALAAGLPVVATTTVVDGLPDTARRGCRAADTASAFADGVRQLLVMPAHDRRALALAAIPRALAWSHQLAPIETILRDASAGR